MEKTTWKPKRFFSALEVEAAMTAKGGFSRKSMAKLGVPWPPPSGWRKAITMRPDRCAREIIEGAPPSKRTPAEWYALIPKLAHWAFRRRTVLKGEHDD